MVISAFSPYYDGYVWGFFDTECGNAVYHNYGSINTIEIYNYDESEELWSIKRGYFDFTVNIPHYAEITKVELQFYVSGTNVSAALYRCKSMVLPAYNVSTTGASSLFITTGEGVQYTSTNILTSGTYILNLGKQAIRDLNSHRDWFSVSLVGTATDGSGQLAILRSTEFTDITKWPKLLVTYTHRKVILSCES